MADEPRNENPDAPETSTADGSTGEQGEGSGEGEAKPETAAE